MAQSAASKYQIGSLSCASWLLSLLVSLQPYAKFCSDRPTMTSEAVRAVSPPQTGSPQNRATKKLRAACNLCHQMKVRCSGTKPCSRCFDSGVECVYSYAAKLGKPKGSRNKKTLERLRQMSEAASGGQTTPPCLPSPRHRSDSCVSKPAASTPEPELARGLSGIDKTEGDYFSLYGHLTPMSRVGGSSSSNSDSLEDFTFDLDMQDQWNVSNIGEEAALSVQYELN